MEPVRWRRIVCGVLLASAPFIGLTVRAQPPAPPVPQTEAQPAPPYYGRWRVSIANPQLQNTPIRIHVVFVAGCFRAFKPDGEWINDLSQMRLDGGRLRGDTALVATQNLEQFDVRLSADGATAQGTWGGFPTSWNRVTAQVNDMAVKSRTRDQVVLELQGTDLPFVDGRSLARCGAAAIDDPLLAVRDATGDPARRTLTLTLNIDPRAPSGPKHFLLNHARMPWEWNFENEVLPKTLTFVERTAQGFQPISEVRFGQPFHVEAGFTSLSYEDERTITLEYGDGRTMAVLLRKTDRPRVFRSGPLVVPEPRPSPPAGRGRGGMMPVAFLVPPGPQRGTPPPAPTQAPTTVAAPPGSTIRVRAGDVRGEVRVQTPFEVVFVGFRDHLGNLLPNTPKGEIVSWPEIGAGEPFVIVVEFAEPPTHDEYPVTMRIGEATRVLTATRVPDRRAVFETPYGVHRTVNDIVYAEAQGHRNGVRVVAAEVRLFVHSPAMTATRASLESVNTSQQFKIAVDVPRDRAASLGPTLEVKLTSKETRRETLVGLRAGTGIRGPVRYTHEGPLTLTSTLRTAKYDVVRFEYADVKVDVKAYESWIQQRLGEYAAAFQALHQFYTLALSKPGISDAARRNLQLRLATIANARQVVANTDPQLDDPQRLAAARAYFSLMETDPAEWFDERKFTGIGAGRDTHYGVVTVSPDETLRLTMAYEDGKADSASRAVAGYRDATLGAYQVFTNATGTNQAMMLFTGTDAMGRTVDNTERFLAGIDLASQAALLGAGTLSAARSAREGAGGLDRARLAPAVRGEARDAARDILLPGVPRPAPARPGAAPSAPAPAGRSTPPSGVDVNAPTAPVPPPPGARPPTAAPPGPGSAPGAANPGAVDPGSLMVAEGRRARELQTDLTADLLERMGAPGSSDALRTGAEIELSAGRSVADSSIVLAERFGVPPDRLMQELHVNPGRVARTLDDYAVARGQLDPAIRERFVRSYLQDRTPPDIDAIVRRSPTPGARPAAPASPPGAAAPPGVITNAPVVDRRGGSVTDPTVVTGRGNAPAPSPAGRGSAPGSSPGVAPDPLAAVPQTARRPPATVPRRLGGSVVSDVPPVAGQTPFQWRGPDGRDFTLRPVGQGRYANVFEITDGPNRGSVIKIYGKQKDVPGYEYARNRPVEFGPNQVAGDIVYGAELLEQHGIPHLKVQEAVFDLDGGVPYVIQERTGPRDRVVDSIEKPLSVNQQRAVVDLYDRMATAGLIWEDGRPGNLFLRDLGNDRWTAGVLDTDRIALFGNVPTERLGLFMGNPVAGPYMGVLSLEGVGPITPANAREYMAYALEYTGWIRYANGAFADGRLSHKIVGERFPLRGGRIPDAEHQPAVDSDGLRSNDLNSRATHTEFLHRRQEIRSSSLKRFLLNSYSSCEKSQCVSSEPSISAER